MTHPFIEGYMNKEAEFGYFDSKEEKRVAHDVKKRLGRRPTGTVLHTSLGALLGGVGGAGIGASSLVPKLSEGDKAAAPIALGMLGLLLGAGGGYVMSSKKRQQAMLESLADKEFTFDELTALAKLKKLERDSVAFTPIAMGGGALGGALGGTMSGAHNKNKHPIELLFNDKVPMPDYIRKELDRRQNEDEK